MRWVGCWVMGVMGYGLWVMGYRLWDIHSNSYVSSRRDLVVRGRSPSLQRELVGPMAQQSSDSLHTRRQDKTLADEGGRG
ncbi:hypothetical protein F4803DRAFT_252009 [Xylaria telfairii]|nr:hypothetical protein F4803DRAFT_252009 [Xylaria telfairii]